MGSEVPPELRESAPLRPEPSAGYRPDLVLPAQTCRRDSDRCGTAMLPSPVRPGQLHANCTPRGSDLGLHDTGCGPRLSRGKPPGPPKQCPALGRPLRPEDERLRPALAYAAALAARVPPSGALHR